MPNIRIALAQIRLSTGNPEANADKVFQAAQEAHAAKAQLLVLPALTLVGSISDLLLRPEFMQQQTSAYNNLIARLSQFSGLHVLFGHAHQEPNGLYNAVSLVADGQVVAQHYKTQLSLPESRYFLPGTQATTVRIHNQAVGLSIGDEVFSVSSAYANPNDIQVMVCCGASEFYTDVQQKRLKALAPVLPNAWRVFVNRVGGQDEAIYDGASFVLAPNGNTQVRLPVFEDTVQTVSLNSTVTASSTAQRLADWPDSTEQVYRALTMALSDYVAQNRFPGALLGLSGGLDSALVLAIAVDALGADNVRAFMLASPYTADISLHDAHEMANGLGVDYHQLSIDAAMDVFQQLLAPFFEGLPVDTTEENIQARIRGVILMALSNKQGGLLLNSSNKSEFATGYSTLYGDMVGGFALLSDVPKTLVYQLARWRNQQSAVIPERIIERPPSAELRADQTDLDSLPPYEILDDIIYRYVDQNQSIDTIVAAGFEADLVQRIARLIQMAEYKRRQAALGPKISQRAFATDWRFPVANAFTPQL